MPQVSKWIGDTTEIIFGSRIRTVTVSNTEYLNNQLKKICFEGDFRNIEYHIGYAVCFRVDDYSYRNYTPVYFNKAAGICEVLFHLHGKGPGSEFASRLREGDRVKMVIPRGKKMYRPESKYHFFFGDETTLGLFKGLKDIINDRDQNYIGVLELQNDFIEIPERLGLMTDTVQKSAAYAGDAIRFLNELDEVLWALWKDGTFYLTGNAASIQHFRKALKVRGINNRNIITQVYWAEGKRGL